MAGLRREGQRKASDGKNIGLKLLPTNRDLVASRGVRHVVEIRLVPGRYQLRVAARERVAGRVGSVFYEIEVPDAAKQPLTLSDLLLTSASANGMFTTGEAPAIGLQLPAPVTTDRTFTRTDIVAAAATVIVDAVARVHDRSDDDSTRRRRHRRVQEGRLAVEHGSGRNGYLSVTAIPLERIAAGEYIVAIEARSRLGATVTRESAIVVK